MKNKNLAGILTGTAVLAAGISGLITRNVTLEEARLEREEAIKQTVNSIDTYGVVASRQDDYGIVPESVDLFVETPIGKMETTVYLDSNPICLNCEPGMGGNVFRYEPIAVEKIWR